MTARRMQTSSDISCNNNACRTLTTCTHATNANNTNNRSGAGIAVLGSESLWDTIMAFAPGYPRALCEFYRKCSAPYGADKRVHSAYLQLLARDDSLVRDGVVPHLAVLVGDATVLRLVHKVVLQHAQSSQPHRLDRKLSLARLMYCIVLFRCVDMLECITELRARDPQWHWERDLLATALRRPSDADLAVLAWLYEHLPHELRVLQSTDMLAYVRTNRVDVVEWLHEHGCAISQRALNGAAYSRRADVLAYLYAHSGEHHDSRLALEAAARDGDLAIVTLIVEHAAATAAGASGRRKPTSVDIDNDDDTVLHIDTSSLGPLTKAMDGAACNGHIEVVRFFYYRCKASCSTLAMDRAAANGHLVVVTFLHTHRTGGCTTAAMDDAARNGHLDVVQFLHTHRAEGCTANALTMAMRNRQTAVIQFLCVHRPECDIPAALALVAAAGDMEYTELLHAQLRPGESAYAAVKAAAERLKSQVVRFLCEYQPRDEPSLLVQAISDRAGWVVQAVSVHASLNELLAAKELAVEQQQPRLVTILDRRIRTLQMSHNSVLT